MIPKLLDDLEFGSICGEWRVTGALRSILYMYYRCADGGIDFIFIEANLAAIGGHLNYFSSAELFFYKLPICSE